MSNISTEPTGPDLSQISEEEHSELVAEIEKLFTSRAATPSEEAPEERKSGALLPVLVNLAAAILLAGGIYLVLNFANRGQAVEAAGELQITQAAVAEALQQEAAERIAERERLIAEREQQISNIQAELRALESNRETAGPVTGRTEGPSERELQLQQQLETLLAQQQAAQEAAEAGAAEAATATASAAAAFEELDAIRQRQEFVVTQLRSLYQSVANAVTAGNIADTTEALDDVDQLLQSPAALQAGLGSLRDALAPGNQAIRTASAAAEQASSEAGSAEAVVGPIAEIRTLVEQADARFEAGETDLAERLYRSAVETLDSTAQAYSQLAAIQQARVDDQIRTLNDQTAAVRNQLQAALTDVRSRDANIATLQRQVSSLTDARNALSSERDAQAQQIAALEANLDQLEEDLSSSRATAASLRGDLRQRNELIESLRAEIASLRDTASDQSQSVATLNATIAAREAELQSIRSQVAALESEVSAQITENISGAERTLPDIQRETVAPDQVVDLLGTKVQLREAVDLPAVRAEYPTLYDDMELYFDALEAESQLTGRRAALSAASEWVENVLAEVAPGSRSYAARPYTPEGYLERLQTLLTALLESVD